MPEATKALRTPFCSRTLRMSEKGLVARSQELADGRVHATESAANRLDFGFRATHLVHVGGGATDVADDALEVGVGSQLSDLVQDRGFAAALDDAALVHRDRAKRAAAKTTTLDSDGKTDHFIGGYFGVAVTGMRHPRVRKFVDSIELFARQWNRRWVEPELAIAVRLNQCACVTWI